MEPLALNKFQSSRSAEYGRTQMSAYTYKCMYYSDHTLFQLCCEFKLLLEIHILKIGNSIMC